MSNPIHVSIYDSEPKSTQSQTQQKFHYYFAFPLNFTNLPLQWQIRFYCDS